MRFAAFLIPAGLLLAASAPAGRSADAPVSHRLMFAEYGKGPNRLLELDAQGQMVRELKPPSIMVIFQPLANGHVLWACGAKPTGVQEVDGDGKVVWSYTSDCPQVLGCRRLKNGNTLVAEQGPPRIVEVDPQGKVVQTTPLKTPVEGYHLQVRNIHKLPNGNLLAAHEGEGAVREYKPDGTVVWEYTGVENAGDVLRLRNGNTLISCGTQKRLIEVTPDKKIAWEFGAADAPDLNLTWVSSLQILRNGHILAGNFLRTQEGKGVDAFEVTHDKKVVWTYANHGLISSLTTVRALDDLTGPGVAPE